MDGRKNNHGTKGNKGGNPGYGNLEFVKLKVNEYSELWWKQWKLMMNSNKIDSKKFAMAEFNKLQIKMIPQKLEGGGEGGEFVFKVVSGNYKL